MRILTGCLKWKLGAGFGKMRQRHYHLASLAPILHRLLLFLSCSLEKFEKHEGRKRGRVGSWQGKEGKLPPI